MGHNRHVAWGVTNVQVDDVDFFIEKINPDNPRQYLYKGRWEDMKVIKETIRIKDKDPVEIEINLTRHGPILSRDKAEAGTDGNCSEVGLYRRASVGQSRYLLAKAQGYTEVAEALCNTGSFPARTLYLPTPSGNIGYWCCATIPVRSRGDGLLPVPGWTGDYEWQGYVPFENRPHMINPAKGYFATANNKIDH